MDNYLPLFQVLPKCQYLLLMYFVLVLILPSVVSESGIGKNCDSETAKQILEGTFDTKHQLSEVMQFIQKCKKDPMIQTFHLDVTQTMFKSAFSGLSEK